MFPEKIEYPSSSEGNSVGAVCSQNARPYNKGMKTPKRRLLVVALLLALPVFAAAPKSLSVLIGGVPLEGKALWYDNQVYVPLESVSKAVGGTYSYDSSRGLASVELGGPRRPSVPNARPYLKAINARSFSTGDNLRVLATVVNSGSAPARDIEITCTFESAYLGEITSSIADLPELQPGQQKTVEFWLYEQRIPDASGGRPYAQPMAVPGSYLARGNDHVYVYGNWERVTHNLHFRFLNPDNTYKL
jgi:hypothetical protein